MTSRQLMVSIFMTATLALSVESFGGSDMTKVYLIPFEVETYVPVTRDSIACEAHEVWTFSKAAQTRRLLVFLSGGTAVDGGTAIRFDEKRVRVKVSSSNRTAFVDSDGVVAQDKTTRIDKREFVELLKTLAGKPQALDKRPHCR
jgi:hypothetical protein